VRAVYISEPGGPEKLIYGERPDPGIGLGDVLVQVRATALNRIDIWSRMGFGPAQYPHIPGADVAGVVKEAGPGVTGFNVGDRVILNPAITCGRCEYCLNGDHGTCRQRRGIGLNVDGGYAEYVKAPEENVHVIPDHLSFDEAAAIPVAFFTAWHVLITRAQVQAGEVVMVLAAGSGVGSAAVQVARHAGGRVIAAAGSDEKLEQARRLGADEGINYNKDDVVRRALEATGDRGVDVIIDPVGAALWEKSLASLKPGGRLVCCGFTGGNLVQMDVRQVLGRRLSILGSGPIGAKGEVLKVMECVRRGQFRGVVDRTFDLKDAALAHQVMESRDFFGKLVLHPP